MPDATLAPATLVELEVDEATDDATEKQGTEFAVQFNPESLRVAYSTSVADSEAAGLAAMQFIAKASTKLDVELWFDATVDADVRNVRTLTARVAKYVTPKPESLGDGASVQIPAVRFRWGEFRFDGVMTSMNETLELFSAEGNALRARVAISLTSLDIASTVQALDDSRSNGNDAGGPGRTPTEDVQEGESLQQTAGRRGNPSSWRDLAAANDIDNPRLPPLGTSLLPSNPFRS